ncbi:MAG: cupin domain-containing protein [candidate division Zixibacteria bacterium]|nr:cupin domain-containing protein [candidate division Zixibacteria bacterium]MCI0596367.1 cupin domain-containing protein [candidate division Zixibacteria bacterium]
MSKKFLIWVVFGILMLISSFLLLFAQEEPTMPQVDMTPPPVFLKPSDLQWKDAPPAVPAGAKVALVYGNPASGPYAQFVKIPKGFTFKPHFHEQNESVALISGTVTAGFGDKIDEKTGTALKTGGYGFIPAGMAHWAVAKTDAIFYQHVSGPASVTYVHPADDPRGMRR